MAQHIEWTFREGKKFPARKPRAKGRDPVKCKESTSSNGLTKYLTILWSDNVLTCDCRGWAILKKDKDGKPKPRMCKHCKASEDSNHADMTAVADFVPGTNAPVKRAQIDFGERQFRKITIRKRART